MRHSDGVGSYKISPSSYYFKHKRAKVRWYWHLIVIRHCRPSRAITCLQTLNDVRNFQGSFIQCPKRNRLFVRLILYFFRPDIRYESCQPFRKNGKSRQLNLSKEPYLQASHFNLLGSTGRQTAMCVWVFCLGSSALMMPNFLAKGTG